MMHFVQFRGKGTSRTILRVSVTLQTLSDGPPYLSATVTTIRSFIPVQSRVMGISHSATDEVKTAIRRFFDTLVRDTFGPLHVCPLRIVSFIGASVPFQQYQVEMMVRVCFRHLYD